MKTSALTISLYVGVFFASMGGFMLMNYLDSNETGAGNVASESAATTTGPGLMSKLDRSRQTSDHQATSPDSKPDETADTDGERIPGATRQSTSRAYGASNSAAASSEPLSDMPESMQRLIKQRAEQQLNERRSMVEPPRMAVVPVVAGYGQPNLASSANLGAESTPSADASLTETGTTTSVDDSSESPASNNDQGSSDVIASDDGSDQANDDDSLPIQDPVIPDDQLMATANCPVDLPQGSTDADAKLMQTTYGCRYLQQCTAANDGTGAQICRWAFYSAS